MRPGTRSPWRTALVVALAATLAGCVGIPTSGPIESGDVVVNDPGSALPLANDPVPDASPERIVFDFFSASVAGFYDNFEVARKYLTTSAANSWDARARVLVYEGGEPTVEVQEDGSILVTVRVVATVDGGGRYTETVPGALPQELVFELRQDAAAQWRIAGLEGGVLMRASDFETQFRRTAVYFASTDGEWLVPDMRWFPERNTATAAVSELLAGPSPWLRDAVRTGAPEGARLGTPAVTVTEGVAVVDLSPEVRLAEPVDGALLQAQLEATLLRLPITSVDVTVGGLPWAPTQTADLVRDVAPERGPYVLQGDRLAVMEEQDDEAVAVVLEDAAPLTGLDARNPAVSPDETIRVVLDGSSRLMLLPAGAAPPVELLSGSGLVAPSIDRHGWIWTGGRASRGSLTTVLPTGEVTEVVAEWLDGRVVRSIRVSRDGTRIAVISSGAAGGDVVVEVAGVVRDENGVPQRLTADRLRVGAVLQDAIEVAWLDEGSLAVLGTSGTQNVPTVHDVDLGGPTESLRAAPGTVGIASGRGDRGLYLALAGGVLYSRQGDDWTRAAAGVRDPVFPG